jgi:type VI secretion system secreted protein VgrG
MPDQRRNRNSGGMNMDEQQRLIRVKSSLGENKFLLWDMEMTESLGHPFVIDLELGSEDHDLAHKDILGDHLTVELDVSEGERRYFDGIVAKFAYTGLTNFQATYRVTLRPWLWLLTRHVQCKIFQGKTVPDIIKEIFRAAEFSDFEDKLRRTDYATLEYCVQYRESDFAFVSRLMEQEGIYYFFKHEEGKHTLVLCDGTSSHGKFADKYGAMRISRTEDNSEAGMIWQWSVAQELRSGQYTLNDYNLKKPKANLEKSKSIKHEHKKDRYEIFDYPGRYAEAEEGATYVGIRMEEQAAQFERARAQTRTRWLATGYLFTLEDSRRKAHNREYLILETRSSVHASADARSQLTFSTEFEAIPTSTTFRSPSRTPKPFIRGPQTAFVVGKSGEEIWTDEYGRVKVQFHWDRDGQEDEKSSCWIRCAQPWASKNWGSVFVPRIGMEVVVHFLEGDPDRPIITGAVYNASSMPPYALPDNATQSTLKSDSSKGGNGSNEIRFEDKAGSEEFFVHAQKDMNIEVENHRSLKVKKGNDSTEISQGNHTFKVSTGSSSTDVMQEITVESKKSITLKVMNSSITIDPKGVTIKGPMISVQGDVQVEVKALMVDIQASAILTAKGGIIMIG